LQVRSEWAKELFLREHEGIAATWEQREVDLGGSRYTRQMRLGESRINYAWSKQAMAVTVDQKCIVRKRN